MARVTVEDCLKNVENRFALVLKAAKRAHMLELGAADPQVPLDNDKPTVIALREIAAGCDLSKTRLDSDSDTIAVEETTVIAANDDTVVEEKVVTTVFEKPADSEDSHS